MLPAVVGCLACPYCGLHLSEVDGALRCGGGHAFDLARQGYVTLLPAGGRHPAGDDAAMVAARADFLAAGHYAPLTAALAAAAGPVDGPVLDVGAGPGHHLAAVLDAAPAAVGIALDASRYAARRAARAHPRAGAVVADAWAGLPVRTGSVAAVLDVFSPRNGAETARVLRPGGVLVVVTPGPEHLSGLVDVLGGLHVDEAKDSRLAAALEPYLEPVDRAEHRWPLALSHVDAERAVAMGPSARHLDDLASRIGRLPEPVRTTASVVVTRYRRP
jgi:23S rRNA (guanine745-N1)-methyltransferase